MRLFVAVDVSDDTRAEMQRARLAIERVLSAAPVPPRIAWVRDTAAHVTVRFIGEVGESAASAIAAALAPPILQPRFDVEWATIGVFPPGRAGLRQPRAIWIGLSSGAAELASLAASLNARLEPFIGRGEDRPYSPHLTIGRVKAPGKRAPWADALAAARIQPTRTRVDHATLYQSHLSSRGPTYTAIGEVRLEG